MADESEKTSIKQLIQGMTGGEVDVLQGTVTAVSPLKIQIANDEKLTISSNNTYVPRHLTNYTTTVDISGGSVSGSTSSAGDPSHTHSVTSITIKGATMTVYNALKVGETVHVLSFKNGKQYYVLDRISS